LLTTSRDRWIFPNQNWEVRNSMMILLIIIILLLLLLIIIIHCYNPKVQALLFGSNSRLRLNDNIKMSRYDTVDSYCFWICSCEQRKEIFLSQYFAGNFLAIWATVSCSRRNLFIRVTSLFIGRWLWIHLYSFYSIVNLLEFHLRHILCNGTLNFYHNRKDMHASLLFIT